MRLGRRRILVAAPVMVFASRARADASAGVLARFSTSYSGDAEHRARASNVQLAADAVDGRVIAPGGVFSFNEAVGERTASFGYAKAIVLRDGLAKEGTGGGACQVASTLHAAALLAGLDVVLRAPHSRPSGYIRVGLDATVAYPSIDLKLGNPGPSPVKLRARAADGTLEVRVDGSPSARRSVTLRSEIVERLPFSRVVERDRSIPEDAVRLVSFGVPGYRVRRVREIATGEGPPRRDVRIDLYPPTSEVVRVAPAFDEARLHLLPDQPMDEEDAARSAARVVVDPAAVRPVVLQLRPSTLVTLDNAL